MGKYAIETEVNVPQHGVTLTSGIFKTAFDNNIAYLKSLSQDSILYWFRKKTGRDAPGEPYRGHFEDNIKGQTAGLFLMGAANSLRWVEDPELRNRVTQIVDEIEQTAEPDGFNQPIPKSAFGTIEYPNYVRVWMNYGLLAANLVGNRKALPLMRGMQTWFNQCDERVIAKDLDLGYQGVIANTTVYFTEVGLKDDIDVTVDYYQENWWLAQFICGNQKAVHKHHRPHGTELEAIIAYMDLYIATGKPLYLNAVNGAYKMFKNQWQHTGGGIVAIEHAELEPGCRWIDPVHKYNELCCSAHWIYLNQRYHQMFPNAEEHVAEIEKSLYNIAVANQAGNEHIRYHAFLDIQKDENRKTPVSCCAGLGTRLYGSLPEFLYSVCDLGLYVDIYSSSKFVFDHQGHQVRVSTETGQPLVGAVSIRLDVDAPLEMVLRLRIPSWTAGKVPVLVNGQAIALGTPGTYLPVSRMWNPGDTVTFELPMEVRAVRYSGIDIVPGKERYAFEYGSLLLAVAGPLNFGGRYILIEHDPAHPDSWLTPIEGNPGHFSILDMPRHQMIPYYEIDTQMFTCFPVFGQYSCSYVQLM